MSWLTGLGGAIIGGIGGLFQQSSAKKAAREQSAFQERMSGSQYQRGMADMKKAGLNPILAYKQGGAGTPGGSSYTPPNIGAAAVAGGTAASNSAIAVKRNTAELLNIAADTGLKADQAQAAKAQANSAMAQARNTDAQTLIAAESLASAKAAASRGKIEDDFYKTGAGKVLHAISLISRSLQGSANMAGQANSAYQANRNYHAGQRSKHHEVTVTRYSKKGKPRRVSKTSSRTSKGN